MNKVIFGLFCLLYSVVVFNAGMWEERKLIADGSDFLITEHKSAIKNYEFCRDTLMQPIDFCRNTAYYFNSHL